VPPDILFIRMLEDADLREDLVGGGGAAHTHDCVIVGRM
jgi:hypothetical protein